MFCKAHHKQECVIPVPCSNLYCHEFIHEACYLNFLSQCYLEPLIGYTLSGSKIMVCSHDCYSDVKQELDDSIDADLKMDDVFDLSDPTPVCCHCNCHPCLWDQVGKLVARFAHVVVHNDSAPEIFCKDARHTVGQILYGDARLVPGGKLPSCVESKILEQWPPVKVNQNVKSS